MLHQIISGHHPMPDWLDDNGLIKLHSAAEIDKVSPQARALWCHVHARYGIPTQELIAWLKTIIGNRRAIEIGSGSGDLAHHLGIQATDSRMQDNPEIRAMYQMTRQPTIAYPPFVRKLEALDAVEEYDPDVVVASWVTRWIDPDKPMPASGGSIFGVKEEKIVEKGITYVLIGNHSVHGNKDILKLDHRELNLPFLRSRSSKPDLNRVWIWNG